MTALARWRRMKEQEERGPVARRPMDTKECNKLADAERFRREILGDISKKIAQIQVCLYMKTILFLYFSESRSR